MHKHKTNEVVSQTLQMTNSPQTLKEKIKEKALALGFELFGVAEALPADPHGHFASWLEKGYHADLDYMARRAKERADPREHFPNVKSVIALGYFYRWPLETPAHPLHGEVSCYAWGSDYHRVVIRKLRKLRAEISLLAPEARLYGEVDTGPVLEKVWAERAGIGWMAKSSNIVSRKGSWFFIAVMMTDLVLPPDTPMKDHCGSCSRCIDECPTKAIIAPGIVDAGRCISYLTIENKQGIPLEFRSQIGHWLFGCDDCQLVCPWQKFDPGAREVKFKPRLQVARPDLIHILQMSEAEFLQNFQGTPLARAGRRGLRRNAIVVLGNLKDPLAIRALHELLTSSPDAMLRGHAAWALGQLGALVLLLAAKATEVDVEVQAELDAALQVAHGR